jgi:hypothetical protein
MGVLSTTAFGTLSSPRDWTGNTPARINQRDEGIGVVTNLIGNAAGFLQQFRPLTNPHDRCVDTRQHLQDAGETPDPLLGLLPLAAHGRLTQRPPHGGCEPRQPILEDVVAGARNQEFDRRLITERAGDHDHRHERVFLAHHLQGGAPVKGGQPGIGEHQVRGKLFERFVESAPGLHPPGDEVEPGFMQLTLEELRFLRNVLQHQDLQLAGHRNVSSQWVAC